MSDSTGKPSESAIVNWLQEHSPTITFGGARCVLEWSVCDDRYKAQGRDLRDAVANAVRYEPDPPAEYRAITEAEGWSNVSDIERIRAFFEGEGSLLTDDMIERAWQQFSTSYCASWLIADRLMFGCFAGWLLGLCLDNGLIAP